MTTETLTFAAETKELLGLMIHSLYERREIFLRELVSNASDALDKLRFEALTEPGLTGPDDRLVIRLEVDREARTLSVVDDGIGMSRDEIVENLGTLARSGTKQFLRRVREEGGEKESGSALPELIGQFGVGFYSSFIVADEVTVETRRAGEAGGWRWRSSGEGEYTIEGAEGLARGTRVTLHLRETAQDADEDEQDFLNEHVLRDVVRRYSDFVEYPIEMEVESDDDKRETTVLNSMKPLWSRPKDDVSEEQYAEFYRHLTHDWEAPLETIHFKAEGTLEYTALLFLPAQRPMDMFEETRGRSRLSLYVRRVLIEAECEELLPPWLRFVRGVIDSPDLPLNVSRDVLQQNAQVRAIKKRLVRKVLHTLGEMLEKDRARYRRFWDAFGAIVKEGIWLGEDDDGRITKVSLFDTTHGDEPSTLAEVVGRMSGGKDTIPYLTGRDLALLRGSPLLEGARKRGQEVLLLTDPVDEWVVQRLSEFEKKKLAALDRGAAELGAAEKEALETKERELRDTLSAVERALAGQVSSVRVSGRLAESPACLVTPEHGLSPNLERILRASNQEVPKTERILELNPDHPLVLKLAALQAKDASSPRIADLAELIHAQALLAEGSPLADPARFSRLVSELVVAGLDV